ncbi:hypothetical protein [Hymenobacter cavernae]|uniref:Entericidin n=1 Tax=Hymenobacter cavernae TaxID=2044852 RepID=A0ABQ1TT25_9BACT|nr:hypothetical protein [Hymenobacter cavernae]GGF00370.1 hypothetical protein GCM10011383_09020 [Hymenobacter cavernae]
MKISFKTLFVAAAFSTFAMTSCGDGDKAANATENAANATENAAENTADAAGNAVDSVKADMATEPGDTAVVQNKEADKLIEETPEKK